MSNDKPLVSFDYGIKYLLKDKGDYAVVEGFISALLKTKGYKDVKIVALSAFRRSTQWRNACRA
jgi:hypothetical protein